MTQAYLVFRVGLEWYGIAVESVIEVLPMVALNELPGTNAVGVMTLRNQTIKVFDLRQRFGLPNPEYRLDTPIIAIKSPQDAIGLVVDEVDDVIQMDTASIGLYSDQWIDGVFRSDGLVIFLLEPSSIVAENIR
jgi:purine-binding chemotaxis protein CheW